MDTTLATIPREKVMAIVYEAIDQVNEQGAGAAHFAKSPDTALYGMLDSLGFVNLIATLEELCERDFGVTIILSDSATESSENPFRTVSTLCDFVVHHLSQLRG